MSGSHSHHPRRPAAPVREHKIAQWYTERQAKLNNAKTAAEDARDKLKTSTEQEDKEFYSNLKLKQSVPGDSLDLQNKLNNEIQRLNTVLQEGDANYQKKKRAHEDNEPRFRDRKNQLISELAKRQQELKDSRLKLIDRLRNKHLLLRTPREKLVTGLLNIANEELAKAKTPPTTSFITSIANAFTFQKRPSKDELTLQEQHRKAAAYGKFLERFSKITISMDLRKDTDPCEIKKADELMKLSSSELKTIVDKTKDVELKKQVTLVQDHDFLNQDLSDVEDKTLADLAVLAAASKDDDALVEAKKLEQVQDKFLKHSFTTEKCATKTFAELKSYANEGQLLSLHTDIDALENDTNADAKAWEALDEGNDQAALGFPVVDPDTQSVEDAKQLTTALDTKATDLLTRSTACRNDLKTKASELLADFDVSIKELEDAEATYSLATSQMKIDDASTKHKRIEAYDALQRTYNRHSSLGAAPYEKRHSEISAKYTKALEEFGVPYGEEGKQLNNSMSTKTSKFRATLAAINNSTLTPHKTEINRLKKNLLYKRLFTLLKRAVKNKKNAALWKQKAVRVSGPPAGIKKIVESFDKGDANATFDFLKEQQKVIDTRISTGCSIFGKRDKFTGAIYDLIKSPVPKAGGGKTGLDLDNLTTGMIDGLENQLKIAGLVDLHFDDYPVAEQQQPNMRNTRVAPAPQR